MDGLNLVPIDRDTLATAIDLLSRAFDERDRSFWEGIVTRLDGNCPNAVSWPIGQLLVKDDRSVGTIFAFTSERETDGEEAAPKRVVNLSSWYIDEEYRWYAPFMLRKFLRQYGSDAVVTDLTPTQSVTQMLKTLRFREWAEGTTFTTPVHGLTLRGTGAKMVDASRIDDEAILSPAKRRMLDDHAAMGCITGVLSGPGFHDPLIFDRCLARSVPYWLLIHAPSRRRVLDNIAAVYSFMARRGAFVVAVDCDEADAPRFAVYRNSVLRKHFWGDLDPDRIDYAYSEKVLLDL